MKEPFTKSLPRCECNKKAKVSLNPFKVICFVCSGRLEQTKIGDQSKHRWRKMTAHFQEKEAFKARKLARSHQ